MAIGRAEQSGAATPDGLDQPFVLIETQRAVEMSNSRVSSVIE